MADPVLFRRVHLGEGQGIAVWFEHRVVAMPGLPSKGPDQCPVNFALENLFMTVWPGEYQSGPKRRPTWMRRLNGFKFIMREGHRMDEIAPVRRFGPIRSENARLPAQSLHLDTGIIREGRQSGRGDGRTRLDPRIAQKAVFGLFRFGQVHFGGSDNIDAIGRKKLLHFFQLARVMGRHENTAAVEAARHETAAFWTSTSSVTPFSARSISEFIC